MAIEDTLIRLGMAVLCGGLLGMERGMKKRPAGFRTYILVCMGATLVMLTNEFLMREFGSGDPSRMGAQVISGIGFLGAGTIIVTGHNRIKGLTTAAGLWVVACLGLAIGVGYYTGALIACGIIFIALRVLHIIEAHMASGTRVVCLCIEFKKPSNINQFIKVMKNYDISIEELEIAGSTIIQERNIAVLTTLNLRKRMEHMAVIELIENHVNGVISIEEFK